MRIAAFSDIHSNSAAFEACIKKAGEIGFDACVFLGDFVSDCAYPERTMDLIEKLKAKYPSEIIRGNREEYLLNHLKHPDDDWKYNSKTGSLLYTFENLSKETIQSFDCMPPSRLVSFSGYPSFEIAHGSFSKSRAMVLPGHKDAEEMFASMQTNLALVGHTHYMFIMQRGEKTIANAGPIGVPGRNLPGASFLMMESGKTEWKVSLHRVEYDIDRVISEMDESGLTQKSNVWARGIKAMLRTGREYLLEVLSDVDQMSILYHLPNDDERLWEEAARKLGI
ncbi:MAG: metallophosphoesterase family protein [Clostridia bacterium]|nr:metallophosphoesterase family protein [Clostridia bacterium]